LWFRLVAKRSTWWRSHRRTTESNTTCSYSHSVLTGLWKRDRQSASTLKVPGICLTTRWMCDRRQRMGLQWHCSLHTKYIFSSNAIYRYTSRRDAFQIIFFFNIMWGQFCTLMPLPLFQICAAIYQLLLHMVFTSRIWFVMLASHCPEIHTRWPYEYGILNFARRWPRTWSTANEQRKQVRSLQKVTRWHPNHTKATRWLYDVVLRVRCVRTRSRRRHVNLREGNLYLLTYYYINEYTSALK
jgi:hypothetical protein